MADNIAVIEPQPALRAHLARMLVDSGCTIWDGEGEPDLAFVCVDGPGEDWPAEVAAWLDEERGTPLVLSAVDTHRLATVVDHPNVYAMLRRPFSRGDVEAALAAETADPTESTDEIGEADILVALADDAATTGETDDIADEDIVAIAAAVAADEAEEDALSASVPPPIPGMSGSGEAESIDDGDIMVAETIEVTPEDVLAIAREMGEPEPPAGDGPPNVAIEALLIASKVDEWALIKDADERAAAVRIYLEGIRNR